MQRLTDDRGAVGVIVALLMIPLMVCTALVVDVGAAFIQRRQLQNATDAAALAVAQDCARGHCGDMTATATSLTAANVTSARASSVPVLTGNKVVVTGSSVVKYSFAPIIGIDQSTVGAHSSARWGGPDGGRAILPLAFSWCAFKAQTGGGVPTVAAAVTIYLPKTDATECNGPTGNPVPGGFGWLDSDRSRCSATTSIAAPQTPSDPGRSIPGSCSTADFIAQQNKTVLLPVYDRFGGTGSTAWYHIYAYAAFRITGYNFGGQYKWNAPCSGSDSCIKGYFTVFVEPSEAFTYSAGAPDLGARIVSLIA